MPHQQLIPGLDRFYCGARKRWIPHDDEIKRLQVWAEKSKGKTQKEAMEILAKEKILMLNCVRTVN